MKTMIFQIIVEKNKNNNFFSAVLSGVPRNWEKCMIKNKAYVPKAKLRLWGMVTMYDCVMACINSSMGCKGVTWDSTGEKTCDMHSTITSGMNAQSRAFSASLDCLSA